MQYRASVKSHVALKLELQRSQRVEADPLASLSCSRHHDSSMSNQTPPVASGSGAPPPTTNRYALAVGGRPAPQSKSGASGPASSSSSSNVGAAGRAGPSGASVDKGKGRAVPPVQVQGGAAPAAGGAGTAQNGGRVVQNAAAGAGAAGAGAVAGPGGVVRRSTPNTILINVCQASRSPRRAFGLVSQ